MNKIKHEESVLVFTYKDTNTLLKFNGSQSWKLDSRRVSKCKYIICVNNAKHPLSQNSNNHGFAFLVGKIKDVSKALETNLEDRWIIEFNEYAEVLIPDFWKGLRNPVNYIDTNKININFNDLEFQKVPERDFRFISEHIEMENKFFDENASISPLDNKNKSDFDYSDGLSIEEAKIGLSKKYKIAPENIEIIMKG